MMCSGSFLFWGEKTTAPPELGFTECCVWNGLQELGDGSPLRLSWKVMNERVIFSECVIKKLLLFHAVN